jgi:hypothetical protein
MIRVEGPDTIAVIKRARDHTQGTVPLILEAAITLLLGCPLARDAHVHILRQSRPARNATAYTLQTTGSFTSGRSRKATTPRRSS